MYYYIIFSKSKNTRKLKLKPISSNINRIIESAINFDYDKFFDNMITLLNMGGVNIYLLTTNAFDGSEAPASIEDVDFIPPYLIASPFVFYRIKSCCVPIYQEYSATPEEILEVQYLVNKCPKCGNFICGNGFINVGDKQWCFIDLKNALRDGALIYIYAKEFRYIKSLCC